MKNQVQKILLIILILVSFVNISLSFTPRTRCSANKLTFTKKFIAYYLNSFRDMSFLKVASNFSDIINYQVYHYGHSLDYSENYQQMHPDCRNFFLSNTSCCTSKDITQFQYYFGQVFQHLFKAPQKIKYPSFSYLYSLAKKINNKPECLVNGKLQLPGVNGATYSNTLDGLSSIIEQHDRILTQIYEFQWQFIRSSICVFCLGTKDFSKFLNPFKSKQTSTYQEKYDEIIYNEIYLKQKVSFITSKLISLTQLTYRAINYFKNSYSVHQIKNTCLDLKNQIKDQAKWERYVVCKSQQDCQLFSIQFFGGVGCPQMLRIFDVISNGGRLLNRGPISISKNSGFRGNTTYENDQGALNDVKQYSQYAKVSIQLFK